MRCNDSSFKFTVVGTSGLTAAIANANFAGLSSTHCYDVIHYPHRVLFTVTRSEAMI